MINKLLSITALAVLMLTPASPAAPTTERVGLGALDIGPDKPSLTDSDVVPAPMILLLMLGTAGLFWGRRLNAGASARSDEIARPD